MATWAKKTKKKTKKLKELSLLEGKERSFNNPHILVGCVSALLFISTQSGNKPEGFVHRPVPTDEGARSEEEGPEDGEAQADPA